MQIRNVKEIRRSRTGNARVFVSAKDENPIKDMLTGARWNRPYQAWRPVVQAELAKRGLPTNVHWSQRAGCACGCSPGFIVPNSMNLGVDLHVTIGGGA